MAFGNPLSAGIALNFDVDMTPYRMIYQNNIEEAKRRKAERQKAKKENAELYKSIVLDTSKIHDRYHDDARQAYASTINDVIKLKKDDDLAGAYKRINEFNSTMTGFVNATQSFRNYEKADPIKTFRNGSLVKDFNDLNIPDDEIMSRYKDDLTYDKGKFQLTSLPRLGVGKRVIDAFDKFDKTEYDYVTDSKGRVASRNILGQHRELKLRLSDDKFDRTVNSIVDELALNPPALMKEIANWKKVPIESLDGQNFRQLATDMVKEIAESRRMAKERIQLHKPDSGSGVTYFDGGLETDKYVFKIAQMDPFEWTSKDASGNDKTNTINIVGGSVINPSGKTMPRMAVNLPKGSYRVQKDGSLDSKINSKEAEITDAIPLAIMRTKDGKTYYKVASKASDDVAEAAYEKALREMFVGDKTIEDFERLSITTTYIVPETDAIKQQFITGTGLYKIKDGYKDHIKAIDEEFGVKESKGTTNKYGI